MEIWDKYDTNKDNKLYVLDISVFLVVVIAHEKWL